MKEARKHDPNVCGIDPATDCDNCRPHTLAYRQRELQLGNINDLKARLEKGGIDVETFADLLWIHIAGAVERKCEEIVRHHVETTLANASIISVIRGIHHREPESKPEQWD